MVKILPNKDEETQLKFLRELDAEKIGPLAFKSETGKLYEYTIMPEDEIEGISLTKDVAEKLIDMPTVFKTDEDSQVYIEIDVEDSPVSDSTDGNAQSKPKTERLYIMTNDTDTESYRKLCETIEKALPALTYTLDYGGYSMRQSEAMALYKCAVINKYFDNVYQPRIDKILAEYDFDKMRDSKGDFPFTDLLKDIIENGGNITKTILMCATNKLVAEKIKKKTSFEGYLSEEATEKLRSYLEKKKQLNAIYNEKFKNSTNERRKLDIKDQLEIDFKALDSSVKQHKDLYLCYQIECLNLNAIPEKKAYDIGVKAKAFASKLVEEKIIVDSDDEKIFANRLAMRAKKLYLARLKQRLFIAYADGVRSNLIPKF